ncbi:glutathione S-transferase family protein [Legionella pneumophila serogroup 2]|nr:glutathione S-transferase family protein [Legionella pneumophila]HBD9372025.1 glutathione S-transferase family protein [Legionella pneumophila]
MGILIDGIWHDENNINTDKEGRFVRAESGFRQHITANGESGFKAEPDRYHLYLSYACPWACRTLIMRKLKRLEKIISVSFSDPVMGKNGWGYGESGNETTDEINHIHYLKELYLAARKDYTGRVTVPVLWDKEKKTIVNNESSEIMRMLNSEFNAFSSTDYDYYPKQWRQKIDEINQLVYENINNGVYKCGFAKSQKAYEEAFDALFNTLNQIENLLATQRYLIGEQLTEADWRLFTTLIRFDAVYHGHFKCNLQRIIDYPHLSNYLRELYQFPGIKETVNFNHIKQHYYRSHLSINPTGIVPKGPKLNLDEPHNRHEF